MIKPVAILCLLLCLSCKQQVNKTFSKSKNEEKKPTIALQPFKGSGKLSLALKDSLEKKMTADFIVLREVGLPQTSYYRPRNRYLAANLLDFLKERNNLYSKIIGVTDKDISIQKGSIQNWGVMGLGCCPGESCVISSFRVRPASINQQVFKNRMVTLALHELGHTFSLPHCDNRTCIMRAANGKAIPDYCKDYCNKCTSVLMKAGVLN